jgi:hypothetical protein
MRALLIVVALILVGILIGWITFSKGPDRPSITIETDKIRADTQKAVQSSADLLHKAGDKIEEKTTGQNEKMPAVENRPAPTAR